MGSNFRLLFVSPGGTKIGYIRVTNAKPYLFLHETSTGRLLRTISLAEHITNLAVTTIGWMPDEQRLFFSLDRTDEDDEWTEPGSLMGSYVVKEDGSGQLRVAPEAEMHLRRPGLNADAKATAVVLNALPDGRYLVRDLLRGPASTRPEVYVYTLNTATKAQETLPIDVPGDLSFFRLSRSGRELAILAKQQDVEAGTFTNTRTLWVFDIESGKQRKVNSFRAKENGPSWIGLIGWLGSR
jgi:hypothetical protein